jgi:hypothetical protein
MNKHKKLLVGILMISILVLLSSFSLADLYLNSRTGFINLNTTGQTRLQITPGGNVNLIGLVNVSIPGNLSVGGNVSVDGSTLFVDSEDNKVGIGTTSPDETLQVEQSISNGYARIQLENTATGGSTDYSEFRLNSTAGTPRAAAFRMRNNFQAYIGSITEDPFSIITNDTERVTISNSGRVGIGTISPNYLLQVASGTDGKSVNLSNVLFVNGTNKSIGIGTISPHANLHIVGNTSASSPGVELLLESDSNENGDTVKVFFKIAANDDNAVKKGGIFFNQTNTFGRGSIHLLTDNTADTSNVDSSDARLTVTSEGNVGIGTSNPGTLLEVEGSNGNMSFGDTFDGANFGAGTRPTLMIDDGAVKGWIQNVGTLLAIGTQSEHTLQFNTNNTAKVTIDKSGSVGIGSTAPGQKLTVAGLINSSLTSTGGMLILDQQFGGKIRIGHESADGKDYGVSSSDAIFILSSGNSIHLGTTDLIRMTVGDGGNVGIGTTSPSQQFVVFESANDVFAANISNSGGDAKGLVITGSDGSGTNPLLSIETNLGVSLLKVEEGGNVGIGTKNPGWNLDVNTTGPTTIHSTVSDSTSYARYLLTNDLGSDSYADIIAYGSTATSSLFGLPTGNRTMFYSSGGNSKGLVIGAHSSDPLVFGTNNAERMRIDESGNVGIGTVSPSGKLDVNGSVTIDNSGSYRGRNSGNGIANFLKIGGGDRVEIGPSNLDNGMIIQMGGPGSSNNYISFNVTGSERMRIDNSGRLGIGTTTPTDLLSVQGDINFGDGTPRLTFNDTADVGTDWAITSDEIIGRAFMFQNLNDNLQVITLLHTGQVGINTTSPAQTLTVQGTLNVTPAGQGSTPSIFSDSAGSVGIGTTNPGSKLEVGGDAVGTAVDVAQIQITGATDPNQQVRIGYDTTSEYGWIQAVKQGTNQKPLSLNPDGGNVGIGTTNPSKNLHIVASEPAIRINGTRITGGASPSQWDIKTELSGTSGIMPLIFTESSGGEVMRMQSNGNVGIGETAPTEKLVVSGNVNITGTLYKGTSAYTNPDIAETMKPVGGINFESGSVVCASGKEPDGFDNYVELCKGKYDKRVVGIVSKNATMIIGSRGQMPVALMGRVFVKATDENGEIEIGDLLTTSSKEGFAMKCNSMNKCQGSVLGKALQSLEGEQGQILALVTLQ